MREKGIDNYAKAQTKMCTQFTNKNLVAIESSRKQKHKHSIKMQDKADDGQ